MRENIKTTYNKIQKK